MCETPNIDKLFNHFCLLGIVCELCLCVCFVIKVVDIIVTLCVLCV